MHSPLVTVVMCVHNGARYVREAVDSVLAQALRDFELILVDDASTDVTPAILAQYADPRIVRLRTERRRGPGGAANEGLALARGALIARLDADDVALPARLARQCEALLDQPALGLLGSAAEVIDALGRPLRVRRPPLSDSEIRWHQLFWCAFTHSSMMIRREVLERERPAYNPDLEAAVDYDLWVRLQRHCHMANLPEVLVQYREHPQSISARLTARQEATALEISRRELAALLPARAPSERDVAELRASLPRLRRDGDAGTPELRALLARIVEAFAAQDGIDPGFVDALRRHHGL